MGFTIATNVSSLNAMRNLTLNQTAQAKSVERLSSGLRINRAADDAAGLSISEGLKNQISGLTQAGRNAQDGISLVQTAEGALTEVHNILNRMRDLAVQASNDTNNADSRTAIKSEIDELSSELGRISQTTNFNGIQLLGPGTDAAANPLAATLKIQVGADANETIDITQANVAATITTLTGVAPGATGTSTLLVNDQAAAAASITKLDAAIATTSEQRANLGAQQNRLESTARTIAVSVENLSAANSRIRDTDMATEISDID